MRTFDAMLLDKVQPRSDTIVSLLYACVNTRWPEKIMDVYRSLPRLGIPLTNSIFAALTAVSSRAANQLPMAEFFFREYLARESEQPRGPSVQVYSAMISAYGRHGRIADAERLFSELESSSPSVPILRAVNALIVAYGLNGMAQKARDTFDGMAAKHSLTYQSATYGALVEALSRCGDSADAAQVLESMRRAGYSPTPAHYGSILHGLLAHDQHEQAAELFERMKELRATSVVAFGMMIEASSRRRDYAKCEQLLAEMKRFGFEPTVDVLRIMMRAAVRARRLDRVLAIGEEIRTRTHSEDDLALPLVMEAHLQAKKHDVAVDIFRRIRTAVPAAVPVALTTLLNFYRKEKMTTRLNDLWAARQSTLDWLKRDMLMVTQRLGG